MRNFAAWGPGSRVDGPKGYTMARGVLVTRPGVVIERIWLSEEGGMLVLTTEGVIRVSPVDLAQMTPTDRPAAWP